jgi:hypothetical protein
MTVQEIGKPANRKFDLVDIFVSATFSALDSPLSKVNVAVFVPKRESSLMSICKIGTSLFEFNRRNIESG